MHLPTNNYHLKYHLNTIYHLYNKLHHNLTHSHYNKVYHSQKVMLKYKYHYNRTMSVVRYLNKIPNYHKFVSVLVLVELGLLLEMGVELKLVLLNTLHNHHNRVSLNRALRDLQIVRIYNTLHYNHTLHPKMPYLHLQ